MNWGMIGFVVSIVVGAIAGLGYLFGTFKRGQMEARTGALEASTKETVIWQSKAERLELDINALGQKISHLEDMIKDLQNEITKRDNQIAELKTLIMMEVVPSALNSKFDKIEALIVELGYKTEKVIDAVVPGEKVG